MRFSNLQLIGPAQLSVRLSPFYGPFLDFIGVDHHISDGGLRNNAETYNK